MLYLNQMVRIVYEHISSKHPLYRMREENVIMGARLLICGYYADWGPLVDVVGYCFLNLSSKYKPPEEFTQWIGKGTSPVYIGFGSMVWSLLI